ncbi:MAG: hypothetical protein ABIH11_05410 [Candidatus Altiarchaeota archaeon]
MVKISSLASYLVVLMGVFLLAMTLYYAMPSRNPPEFSLNKTGSFRSFTVVEGDVCTKDGKPIVRMYSTELCPHCRWIGPTFDKVASEYAASGRIVAYHWSFDAHDDVLTTVREDSIPGSEESLYYTFNPSQTVPTFVFGCKYYRVGNAHERDGGLAAEEADFRAVIEELL